MKRIKALVVCFLCCTSMVAGKVRADAPEILLRQSPPVVTWTVHNSAAQAVRGCRWNG